MIYVMGGGTGKLFATIGVTYPANSTCTCTGKNSGKVFTAKSNPWIFNVPEADEWTMVATGGNNPSKTINITAEGQVESVTLNYSIVLFDAGDNTEETGGWDYSETKQYGGNESSGTEFSVGTTLEYRAGRNYNNEGTDTRPRKGTVYNKKAIDLTGYSRLRVVSEEAGATLRIISSETDDIVATMDLSVGGNAIEISHLSKEDYYYISIYNNADGDVAYPIEISEMVLE